jgi:hypothetical protein
MTTVKPGITDYEVISRTTTQLILIALSFFMQIFIIFKKQTKTVSPLLFLSLVLIIMTYLLSPDKEKIKELLYICLLILISILFMINIPFSWVSIESDNLRLFTKQILVCCIVFTVTLAIFIGLQFDDDIDDTSE